MRATRTRLDGPLLIEPVVHGDTRGFFLETYRRGVFAELGIDDEFVQDNQSRSRRGIVRGMHFQPGMSKLIRCARGAILDALVDIRPGSITFGEWEAFALDDESHLQLYCPDGFAHGFCTLTPDVMVAYKVDDYYSPEHDRALFWNDPAIGIPWPVSGDAAILSDKDRRAPKLADLGHVF